MSSEGRVAPGICVELLPGLRRVIAPNPSAMTLHGTNSYLVGAGEVALVDPGPEDAAHEAALLGALGPGERISHVFITHAHRDHSPLGRRIAARTGAPVLAFGDSRSGRSARMAALGGASGGGEGVDTAFTPDRRLADGETVSGTGWRITALHTPGHMGNHMCFAWDGVVFSGDHVMGWASTLVSPPDGDMTDYMASLVRLESARARLLMPGHGSPVTDPAARIADLRAHRLAREAQILAALGEGAASSGGLAARLYHDTPSGLLGAAQRNVLAHLIDLETRGLVAAVGTFGPDSHFRRI